MQNEVLFDTNIKRASREVIPKLSVLEADLAICAIEDSIDKLLIIGAQRPLYAHNLLYNSIKDRFATGEINSVLFDPETNEMVSKTQEKRKWAKLQKDRDLAVRVLSMIKKELMETRTFACLLEFVHVEREVLRTEGNLETGYDYLMGELTKVKKLIIEDEAETSKLLAEKTELSKQLEDQIENILFQSGVRIAYSKEWEKARIHQNTIKYKWEELELQTKLDEINQKIKDEEEVHEIMVQFLTNSIEEMEESIEEWGRKYHEDIEEYDILNTTIKRTLTQGDEHYGKLRDVFEKRKKFIGQYLVDKQERDNQEKIRKYVEMVVTKLQAAWRGYKTRQIYTKLKKMVMQGKPYNIDVMFFGAVVKKRRKKE